MLVFFTLAVIAVLLGYFVYYVLPRQQKKIIIQEPHREEYYLSPAYGEDELVVMAQDPEWLYAYWEITPTKIEEFKKTHGNDTWEMSLPLLRLYQLDSKDQEPKIVSFHDIPINSEAQSWYMRVGRPDTFYQLELGRMTKEKGFISLVRSNLVRTPRNSPSTIIDPLWPPIEALWHGLIKSNGFSIGGVSSVDAQRR